VDKAFHGLCPLDRPQETPRVSGVDGLSILLGRSRRRKYSRQEENLRGTSKRKPRSSQQPGTKAGTTATIEAGSPADLVELFRVLASLTPEEVAALLTLAKGLRSPAT
jgi:hypothetical protein